MRFFYALFLVLGSFKSFAQIRSDSTKTINEIVIKGLIKQRDNGRLDTADDSFSFHCYRFYEWRL